MVAEWIEWASELVDDWPDDVRNATFNVAEAEESLRRVELLQRVLR